MVHQLSQPLLLEKLPKNTTGLDREPAINTTQINRHFTPAYSLGTTKLLFVGLTELEPSIYLPYQNFKLTKYNSIDFYVPC